MSYIRPTPAPVGRLAGAPTPASISSSSTSGSLCPPAAKSLIPLSGMGLCEAEIITPRSAPRSPTRCAMAGVGSTPTCITSAPAEVSPAHTAACSISPLARGSRPTTATGRCELSCATSTRAAAAATDRASSGVRSPLASPRTPSVPNSRAIKGYLSGEASGRIVARAFREHASPNPIVSALAVLGRLAGLLQTVLLALLDPRVTGEEAGLLQRLPGVAVPLDQRAGDGQAQRAGLPGDAAALEVRPDVERLRLVQDHQRLADELLVHLVREVLLQRLAVQLEL